MDGHKEIGPGGNGGDGLDVAEAEACDGIQALGDLQRREGRGLLRRDITAPEPTDRVREGDELTIAGLGIRVLHTPGHTPGSVCYLIENELFTGDTLFEHGWGRTDLPGGNEQDMYASLRRIMPLARQYPMHAGH